MNDASLRPRLAMSRYPQRIVCLTEETTETLYLLGQGDRVVGVSGYTVRPPEARQKPKVSAFINARFDKIEALAPDLVLAFSDLQADLVRELIRRGHRRRHVQSAQRGRDSADDPDARRPGRLSGRGRTRWRIGSAPISTGFAQSAERFPRRLRAFFEEWDDPLISGIRWVEELVEIAGGAPIFPELASAGLAKNRIVESGGGRRARSRGRVRVLVRKESAEGADPRTVRTGAASARSGTTASSRSNRPTSCSRDRPA